jgi:hypothetical protein
VDLEFDDFGYVYSLKGDRRKLLYLFNTHDDKYLEKVAKHSS